MIKVHYSDDQEELLAQCGGHMARLIETERGVKSAASDLVGRSIIEQFRPDKDHFLIHQIAMGDQETYGPNKNADGWPKQALAKHHQTFVTHGHMFREHRNRDPKKKIGDIKYAAYCPVEDGGMGRVELLMWGHKKKAEKEYELAKAGKELHSSMSARVPDDECSCCGNFAKSPESYCSHLKEAMPQYLPEFRKYAFAVNHEPTFFDNSSVENPADRIAHFLEYRFADNEMRKAASAQSEVILGTDWAEYEGVMIPDNSSPAGLKGEMLKKLAAQEEWRAEHLPNTMILSGDEQQREEELHALRKAASIRYTSDPKYAFANSAVFALDESLSEGEVKAFQEMRPGSLFRELAKRACLLPFPVFAAYAMGEPDVQKIKKASWYQHAANMLPGVFRKLATDGCASGLADLFDASGQAAADDSPDVVQQFMDQVEEKFSIDAAPCKERMVSMVAKSGAIYTASLEKSASTEYADQATTAVMAYGHYQISALADIERLHGNETIDDPQTLLAVSHNSNVLR